MGAREAALNTLIACRKNGAWSNGELKRQIAAGRLDARDAALAARLCYGIVQNRGQLDFYLRQMLSGKISGLHPVVRDVLHMGLYQLCEMDKIPANAAVNESVKLVKKYCPKQKNAPALVNAVLRHAVRTQGTWEEPVSYADKYSHPDALITLLKQALPKGMLEPMLIADNTVPPLTIQVNTLKVDTETLEKALQTQGIGCSRHAWMKDCLTLSGVGNLEQLEQFQHGDFYVQDPASRLSVLCAGLQEGQRVLDCCAAPGGKSFAAAIAMGGRGTVVSCDIYPHKTKLIAAGAERMGLEGIQVLCRDATAEKKEWAQYFDTVIADVPCSGLGIIRKKPDIRYKDLQETEALPQLQKAILDVQSQYIRPGGVMMYSTCTVLPRENEQVIELFLRDHADFEREPLKLPDNFPQNTTGRLTLYPGQYDTDGFFICRLRRKQ